MEDGGRVRPAPVLCAADRDDDLRFAGDDDRGVEDPVLLCTCEFLAVDEEDRDLSPVPDHQFGDGPRFSHFRDDEAVLGECLGEREVVAAPVRPGKERDDFHPPVDGATFETQRCKT